MFDSFSISHISGIKTFTKWFIKNRHPLACPKKETKQ